MIESAIVGGLQHLITGSDKSLGLAYQSPMSLCAIIG